MKCQDAHELLPLFLYEELDDETTAALGEHLQGCGACTERLAELKATTTRLDEWTPIESDLDVRAIVERAMPSAPVNRWSWRPTVVGLAAGLLLAITLFFVGVDVQRTDGQLLLSFGRGDTPIQPAVPEHLVDFDPAALEARVQLATFEQIDQRQFELAEDVTRFLERWDAMQAQQRTELLELFARSYQEDLSRLEEGFSNFALEAVEDSDRTWRRLNELQLAVQRGEIALPEFND